MLLLDLLPQAVFLAEMPGFLAFVDGDRFRARGGQLQRIGQPGFVIAPPDRRSSLLAPPLRYSEARRRERDVILPGGTTHAGRTPAHWRRVALIVARMAGKRVGVDTATRMLE